MERARLTRENTRVNAASSVVLLQDGVIRQVDAVKAQGIDEYPKRKLQYAADDLHVTYIDWGQVEHMPARITRGWFPFRRARKPP